MNHFVNGGLEKYLGVYLFLHLFIFDIFEVFISFLTRCPFLNKGAGPAVFIYLPVATLKNNGLKTVPSSFQQEYLRRLPGVDRVLLEIDLKQLAKEAPVP